ncbi:hypothetical protein [Mesorhizobium tamadayense]|uniref:hypothetical protein n=1 Tax=Mesorhizobium tamadayense TaxID=425306 RepID=UPI00142E8F98
MAESAEENRQGLIREQNGEIAAWSFLRRFGHGYVIGPVGAGGEMAARALIARWISDNGSEFRRIDDHLPSNQAAS